MVQNFIYENLTNGETYKPEYSSEYSRNVDRNKYKNFIKIIQTIIKMNNWKYTDKIRIIEEFIESDSYIYENGKIIDEYTDKEFK